MAEVSPEFQAALDELAKELTGGGGEPPARTVPVPTQTLGGRRMEGRRSMTVQEQTMLERPWVQMGRDAGAFASSAANTAGFGLPGIVLENFAPNVLSDIRENESLANPLARVGGAAAGIYMMPLNALARGFGHVGEAFASLPTWAKGASVVAPVAAVPSEAGSPGVAAKDYEAPGLMREIWNALPGVSVQEDRPLTADEFRQQRRQLLPRSRADYIQSEVDKVRNSERYQTAGKTLRENLENSARSNAEKLYGGYQQDVADETARIDREYGDYRSGWDRQRSEHLNKQFVERHPNAGMALTVGGPIASALFTRGIFGKVNKMGDEIATAGQTARTADDMRALADSIVRADKYATYAPATKAATAVEAAAIPAELRMTGDIIDKKGLPPDAGARTAATQRMADWPSYLGGMGYDVVSGAIGTGTGSLWAKARTPSPGVDLSALRNNAAGIERGGWPEWLRGTRMSQDEISAILADRAARATMAQQELNAARRGVPISPASSGDVLPAAPGPGTPSSSASPMGGALVPQRSSAPVVPPNALAGPRERLADRLPKYEEVAPPPAREALPNQPTSLAPRSDGRPPLPPGLDYNSAGLVYDLHTGQIVRKRYFQSRND